jgi:hypothetical protein
VVAAVARQIAVVPLLKGGIDRLTGDDGLAASRVVALNQSGSGTDYAADEGVSAA